MYCEGVVGVDDLCVLYFVCVVVVEFVCVGL